MPSQLVNLKRTLTWSDFGTPKKKPAPKPGEKAVAAHTQAKFVFTKNPSMNPVPGSSPAVFKMSDDVIITVEFVKSESWVADWVFTMPKSFQDDLLKHEQGHYWVSALLGRDLFIDVMALKAKTYSSAKDGGADFNAVNQKYAGKTKTINDLYDEEKEAAHGRNATGQKKWDGLFNRAFTEERTPPMQAPDGVMYKKPLLEILKGAGFNV